MVSFLNIFVEMGIPTSPSFTKIEMASVTITKDISYAGIEHFKQKLDLYVPIGKEQETLVAFVHGGAWISSDRADFEPFGKHIAAIGLPIAILGYRLTIKTDATPSVFPDPVLDIALGIELLWENCQDLIGYRPKRLVLCGHSAGAQISGLLALDSKWLSNGAWKWIEGVVGIEGIYDIYRLAQTHEKFIPWFIELQFPDISTWKLASPHWTTAARNDLKYAVVYSKEDEYEMEVQSVEFVKKLEADGINVVFESSLNGSHDGILNQDNLVNFIKEFAESV